MSPNFPKLFRPKAAKNSGLTTLGAKFEHASFLNQRGQLAEATATCREILERQPDHFESLTLLAEIEARREDPEQAIQLYTRVINLRPGYAPAYYKRGNLLKDRNRMEAALASYDQAVALDPGYANAFCNRGVVLGLLNRPDEALANYDRAIALNSRDALAFYNRGNVLRELKRLNEALASYDQAIAVRPDYAEAYCNRGVLLQELKEWDAALVSYDRCIEIEPGISSAYLNRGNLFRERKKLDAALASYNRAIEIDPDYAEAYCNRGVLFTDLRQWDAAFASLNRAIELKPGFAEAYCYRGKLFAQVMRIEAAIASFDRAVALKPDCVEAYQGRGFALLTRGQHEAAMASFDHGIALKADQKYLLAFRRYVQMQICDWDGLAPYLERLEHELRARKPLIAPFQVFALIDSPPLQRLAAEIWVREECPPDDALGTIQERPRGDKIRIGYFSADFRNHPVSLLTAELFETHDRSRFEIIAFALGPKVQDAVRARLERAFDRFIDVGERSDLEVAETARRLGIDIAVDLGGFTDYARPKIFALRAAPIQMSYIGYLGTMGAPYMDYLLADPTIIPAEEQQSYSEAIIYLPSYQVNDSKRPVVERTLTREELGLPATGFVFSCFNANYKITPATFAVWMRILLRVEGSSFFLYAGNEVAERNLGKEAERCGVDSRRMVFGKFLAQEDYLARFRAMDLFLDTLPYNAGTTASDALWAGLPVLTCAGQAFAGRVAASLLEAIELPELVTSTAGQYEEMAVQLAENPELLSTIKRKLAQNRLETALFDTRSFTKHLEVAYTRVQERHCAGLAPQTIFVTPNA
jgi:protein O-GlcNAc transferase